jgi:hypothetical protein
MSLDDDTRTRRIVHWRMEDALSLTLELRSTGLWVWCGTDASAATPLGMAGSSLIPTMFANARSTVSHSKPTGNPYDIVAYDSTNICRTSLNEHKTILIRKF